MPESSFKTIGKEVNLVNNLEKEPK